MEATAEQVAAIAAAAHTLSDGAGSVVGAMESISAVVEENTAATEEMAAQTQDVTQTMQGIAGIADDNSTASELVADASESMRNQVRSMIDDVHAVSATAEQPRAIVARFRLDAPAATADMRQATTRRRGEDGESADRGQAPWMARAS